MAATLVGYSEIAAAKLEMDQVCQPGSEFYVEAKRRLDALKAKRAKLRSSAATMDLKVKPLSGGNVLDDLTETDDAGRRIEATLRVTVSTVEEAQKAIEFAKQANLMAMPVGTKTSALGVFEAASTASKRGFDGVLGIEIMPVSVESRISIPRPSFNPNDFDIIPSGEQSPIYLLKSKTFPDDPSKPHRIVAHAGLTIEAVNQFIETNCKSEKYAFRLKCDPTSKKEAQLGGVVSTGAEGPDRMKIASELNRLCIVNGNAESEWLEGAEAASIVGLGGNAGLVMEVDLDVSAYPKTEVGALFAIKGKGKDAWLNMLELQDRLKEYTKTTGASASIQVGAAPNGRLVTGAEPLSKSALAMAATGKANILSDRAVDFIPEDDEYCVFVTFSTHEDMESFLSGSVEADEFFTKAFGVQAEADKSFYEYANEGDDLIINTKEVKTHSKVWILSDTELKAMDELRHAAPGRSREVARTLGDVTQSTDLNIRIQSEDPDEKASARAAIANICAEYEAKFPAKLGFRVVVYGHLQDSYSEGGGIDPHIRIIFELSNPRTRFNTPELVQLMKKHQTTFYQKLLALNGKDGIQIQCPEKSRFTTADYWHWLSLVKPEEARAHLAAVKRYGYSKDSNGNPDRPVLGARVPHELPGFVDKLPGGIKSLLNEALIDGSENPELDAALSSAGLNPLIRKYLSAILEFSQTSHRSAPVRQLYAHLVCSIQERFRLSDNQYAFFIESPAEAKSVLERNFGKDYESKGYRVEHRILRSLDELGTASFPDDPKTFYVVDLEGIGVPSGLSLLISPHQSIRDAYEASVSKTNTSAFRNLYSMWSKWPYETDETPNVPAATILALILEGADLAGQSGLTREYPLVTVNPGPAQLHPDLLGDLSGFLTRLASLMSPEEQIKTIELLRSYLGIPPDHAMTFFASATQIMEVIAEALKDKSVNVIQVTNDAFSERLNSILRSKSLNVKTITTPWTTSEQSELDSVVDGIIGSFELDGRNLLFVTPHKTSTAAHFHPDVLVDALKERGYLIGTHFELICDVTSGMGAINYATKVYTDHPGTRPQWNACFASLQKAMQQAPGLALFACSARLAALLSEGGEGDAFSMARYLEFAKNGNTVNPFALALLRHSLEANERQERTPASVQSETKRKLDLVMGWKQRHPKLITLVPNGLDQSPALVGLFAQGKNLVVAKRIMEEMGYCIGGGYGPYEKEGIRLYLPNITEEKLKELLAALDLVLELEDVTETRSEAEPNVALREPHNVLSVIQRLSSELTTDDIFTESLALTWVGRLITTYNAILSDRPGDPHSPVSLPGHQPQFTDAFKKKAGIYAFEDNFEAMQSVLNLEDPEDGTTLIEAYSTYHRIENELRELAFAMAAKDIEALESDVLAAKVQKNLDHSKVHLAKIAKILSKFAFGNGDTGPHLTEEGRIALPLVA